MSAETRSSSQAAAVGGLRNTGGTIALTTSPSALRVTTSTSQRREERWEVSLISSLSPSIYRSLPHASLLPGWLSACIALISAHIFFALMNRSFYRLSGCLPLHNGHGESANSRSDRKALCNMCPGGRGCNITILASAHSWLSVCKRPSPAYYASILRSSSWQEKQI